jgi:rubrerythrin
MEKHSTKPNEPADELQTAAPPRLTVSKQPLRPLPNYSLSTECPACGTPTYRHACKVRCPRCGFVWDCSEL